jgi:hypothetical protein
MCQKVFGLDPSDLGSMCKKRKVHTKHFLHRKTYVLSGSNYAMIHEIDKNEALATEP